MEISPEQTRIKLEGKSERKRSKKIIYVSSELGVLDLVYASN